VETVDLKANRVTDMDRERGWKESAHIEMSRQLAGRANVDGVGLRGRGGRRQQHQGGDATNESLPSARHDGE
jgi:hypothetical protein